MSFALTKVTDVGLVQDKACSICQEDFTVQNGRITDDVVSTKCKHLFHADCEKELEQRGNGKCPNCKRDLIPSVADKVASRASAILRRESIVSNVFGIISEVVVHALTLNVEVSMRNDLNETDDS